MSLTIKYYGVEGAGRNVTEAKKDAGRKIEASLTGSYTPTIVAWRGNAVLVFREPGGWCTRLIADSEGIREGRQYGHPNHSQEKDAIKEAREHVAQLGWRLGDEPPEFLARESVPDFQRWAEFQTRYAEARERGLTDNDAHAYAGRDPARAALWQ